LPPWEIYFFSIFGEYISGVDLSNKLLSVIAAPYPYPQEKGKTNGETNIAVTKKLTPFGRKNIVIKTENANPTNKDSIININLSTIAYPIDCQVIIRKNPETKKGMTLKTATEIAPEKELESTLFRIAKKHAKKINGIDTNKTSIIFLKKGKIMGIIVKIATNKAVKIMNKMAPILGLRSDLSMHTPIIDQGIRHLICKFKL